MITPIDVTKFKIRKFLESRNITDMSRVVVRYESDKIEIYNDNIYKGVVR
jgi:hypothetical protein